MNHYLIILSWYSNIIIALFYKYLYSSEYEYHKYIHEYAYDLNEVPIAKFKFPDKIQIK